MHDARRRSKATAVGLTLALGFLAPPPSLAEQPFGFYAGYGLGSGDVPEDQQTESALQVYVGRDFDRSGGWRLALEAGYLDTGHEDDRWASAVMKFGPFSGVDLLLRGGLNLGDNRGAVIGLGIAHAVESDLRVRLEAVDHGSLRSLLFSVEYYPYTRGSFLP